MILDPLPHLHVSARNQALARWLHESNGSTIAPSTDDWVITMIFYSSLHLVDAYSTEVLGEKPRTHRYRSWLVRSDPALSRIRIEYLRLNELSRTARYDPLAEFSLLVVQQAFDDLELIREVVADALEQPK